jgi:SAM-dependent MidA family methyltransferase
MLPEPDDIARAHSAHLCELIAGEIATHGPIPFQRYMELALYAPGLGYYAAGAQKFGAAGDFITAPELGSVFAETLAEALATTLRQFDSPVLMELGAGSGALAVDLLGALARREALPARYLILERSADLRQRQRKRIAAALPALAGRVEWLDQPPSQPFDGAIVGNEVVDALACARFVVNDHGVAEIAVDWRDGRFVETRIAARPAIHAAFEQLAADYGYGRPEFYRADRHAGTLICHYRQHAHADPYWHPGLNDLSASVDFTALAEAGAACGLDLMAYDNQSGFLIGAGIEGIYAHLDTLDDRTRLRITSQIKQLMLPGEMGERFKVMLLGRGADEAWLPDGLLGEGQRRMLG